MQYITLHVTVPFPVEVNVFLVCSICLFSFYFSIDFVLLGHEFLQYFLDLIILLLLVMFSFGEESCKFSFLVIIFDAYVFNSYLKYLS
mmetsp:Transcript_506/g.676  ORF Transcript_506/g.676 Transcript_506/m.676 type:complete len:88 (+) Transcript_506:1201-1464(+)